MDYIAFFNKLKDVDPRIDFQMVENSKILDGGNIPAFYSVINPINVEFEYNDGIIRLEPIENFDNLKKEYDYVQTDCIFASCNGEPIYLKDKKVFTCIRGSKRIIEEEIASSINMLLESVYKTL